MMRIVLDTNVLLSACWKPDGLEARLVALVTRGAFIVCVSTPVLAEYHDVLFRPKFLATHRRAGELLSQLEAAAIFVEPAATLSASSDDDDNRFLECAAEAKADYLVTGNLRHYPAVLGQTRILNARAFFNLHPGALTATL